MIIANQKKEENIAEYILYMWQIEEIVRIYNFDIEKINKEIIENYRISEKEKEKVKEWYADLIFMMQTEMINKTGHLQIIKNIVIEINNLSIELLSSPQEIKYQQIFEETLPEITGFQEKSNIQFENNIDICLHALNAIMLLRLKKQKISKETSLSIKKISKLLALLSQKYIYFKENEDL